MNFASILAIAFMVFFFWFVVFRPLYVYFKNKKANDGISLPDGMDKVALMQCLQTNLNYPSTKSIAFDQNGDISLAATHGVHKITIEDGKMFVEKFKGSFFEMDVKKSYYTEEGDCILAYAAKIFNPNTPQNPYEMFKHLKLVRKLRIAALCCVWVPLVIFFSNTCAEKAPDVAQSFNSNYISTSYLTQYSSEHTIGEVFNDFFTDPEWGTYEFEGQEYVYFVGGCTFMDEPASMRIVFAIYGEMFQVEKILINGEDVIFYDEVLQTIYDSYEG